MASQLTSSEIVLGKLFVRMLYVGVLLGVSVPVMSLLVMLGGIDPWLIVLSCGATLSTAWFLATLSIWVSTIATSSARGALRRLRAGGSVAGLAFGRERHCRDRLAVGRRRDPQDRLVVAPAVRRT